MSDDQAHSSIYSEETVAILSKISICSSYYFSTNHVTTATEKNTAGSFDVTKIVSSAWDSYKIQLINSFKKIDGEGLFNHDGNLVSHPPGNEYLSRVDVDVFIKSSSQAINQGDNKIEQSDRKIWINYKTTGIDETASISFSRYNVLDFRRIVLLEAAKIGDLTTIESLLISRD